MKYTIENLSFEELAAFLRMQAEDAFPDLKDEQRLNALAEKWSANAEICTCRDEQNQLIGMIAFYANRPEDLIVYIPHVYVSSLYRKIGVFKRMLDLIIENVIIKGYNEIRLEVDKKNKIAQTSYMKNGFNYSSISTEKSFYMLRKISSND